MLEGAKAFDFSVSEDSLETYCIEGQTMLEGEEALDFSVR